MILHIIIHTEITPKLIQKAINWYILTLATERKEKSQILALPTKIIHTKYWSTGSSKKSYQSSSCRLTRNCGWGYGKWRYFACGMYNSLEGDCHRRGAERCAWFQRSFGGKLEGHIWDNSTGHNTLSEPPHIEYSSSDWCWTLCLPLRMTQKIGRASCHP